MKKHFRSDPGAVLLLGLLLFTVPIRELTAIFAAAAVHELGHVAMHLCFHVPIRELRFTMTGPVLCCDASERLSTQLLTALGGPAFGLIWFAIMHDLWPLSAEVSLLLSVLNILPVLPLDGARILLALFPLRADKWLSFLGLLIPAVFMTVGLMLVRNGSGFGVFLFGVWMLILSCQYDENDVRYHQSF